MICGTFMKNLISADELIALLSTDDTVIFDCRFDLAKTNLGHQLYSESHIPGAAYLSLDDDLSGALGEHGGRHPLPSVDDMAQRFGKLGIKRNVSRVIAYDDSGSPFAARLWWMLRYLGHEQVQVLDGGFAAYKAAGGQVTNEIPQIEPQHFLPDIQHSMLATVTELANVDTRSSLIDCRAPERFLGNNETIDSKAGHIPGAQNIHWMDGLDEEKHYRPVEEQKQRFAAVPKDPIMYCGSGVTACVNVLAYEEAGLGTARVYAGSWSDWISYEKNEIATGE
jgi:thiosulfate/3-mercaptopyruvate sulfurtransferase